MSEVINIAVSGATGKMGQLIAERVIALQAQGAVRLSALLAHSRSDAVGTHPFPSAPAVSAGIEALPEGSVLIDFTRPEATLSYLPQCIERSIPLVIGTTGFDKAGTTAIEEAARHIPIVFSANMSLSVNITMMLIEKAAAMLPGEDYDCEIFEMHHRRKVDAPSGTALAMGRAVAKARGVDFDNVAVLSREGHTGARKPGTIGFAALRGGSVVGDHTVIFASDEDRIEITHKSASRESYAKGAVEAALFLKSHQSGLFSMRDVLQQRFSQL